MEKQGRSTKLKNVEVTSVDTKATPGTAPCKREALLVPGEHSKTCLVRRLATCNGPLACHALQGRLHWQVSVCAAAATRGGGFEAGELEEWLLAVLDTIANCLGEVQDRHTTAQHLRCAIVLLQLCSTILKTERAASHPERASHPSVPPVPSAEGACITKAGTAVHETACRRRESVAAQACAKLANAYLGEMVRAATALMLRDVDGGAKSGCAGEGLGGEDAVFWVLSLLTDVLKHLRKREWRFGGCTEPMVTTPRKRTSDGEVIGPLVGPTTRAASAGGSTGIRCLGVCGEAVPEEQLDVVGLARLVSAVPVGCGAGMVDVALKWLEVTELVMDAAEARGSGVLTGIFRSVPPTLWRLAHRTGSLLLDEGFPRSPGSAFVEKGGGDGALAQAMLSLVFRMVRLGNERGLLVMPGDEEDTELVASRREGELLIDKHQEAPEESREGGQGGGLASVTRSGQQRRERPWSTAVDALMATVAASPDAESHLGFAGRLVRLFCDQDDALVDMLLTNLHIFLDARSLDGFPGDGFKEQKAKKFPLALRLLYNSDLHPATLFAALLSEVRFDPGVLLDWLISPETSFLPYLTLLLRLAVAEWPDFAARVSCASLVALEKVSSLSVPTGKQQSKNGGKEEKEEEEVVLSEEEAERLGRAVLCLSGLVASTRALEKNGLVPYNLAPLLRRIEQVVSLYEDCGDTQEGGRGGRVTLTDVVGVDSEEDSACGVEDGVGVDIASCREITL